MGYMGFGLQSWITNMKPRPFFGRRDRPGSEHAEDFAGHDTQALYHLKQNKLENLNQKKPTANYLKLLRSQLKEESKRKEGLWFGNSRFFNFNFSTNLCLSQPKI